MYSNTAMPGILNIKQALYFSQFDSQNKPTLAFFFFFTTLLQQKRS